MARAIDAEKYMELLKEQWDEIDGLERKIEYLNFVMAAVEASDAEN